MIQTFRQIYFALQKLKDPYLNESVIKEYLCFVGNFDDFTTFFMHLDDEVDFNYDNEDIKKLREGKPVQQIIGYQYFYGHKLYVDDNVLIPRQETENLVELVAQLIAQKFGEEDISILDLCCGSGAIGLSLSNSHTKLTLSDISKDALKNAKRNAKHFDVTDARFVVGDLFENIKERYDVIVCNPPYIEDEKNIDEQVYRYEPHLALIAKPGYIFYERVLKDVKDHLYNKFILAFEIGENMEEKLTELIKKYLPKNSFIFYKDICNKTRFVIIEGE